VRYDPIGVANQRKERLDQQPPREADPAPRRCSPTSMTQCSSMTSAKP